MSHVVRRIAVGVVAVVSVGALAVALTGTADAQASSGSWKSCAAPVRSYSGLEVYAKFSKLQARGKMNCASARYAYAAVFGKAKRNPPIPSTFNDGDVTWHRSLNLLSGPSDGCGTWRTNVTYREYSSNTAFRFHLVESGC